MKTIVSPDLNPAQSDAGPDAVTPVSVEDTSVFDKWVRPRVSLLAHIRELWQYRGLIRSLVARDL